MKIWTSAYQLRPRLARSERESQSRRGVLLRVEGGEWEGFADLHAWPELGDASIEAQLESLAARRPLPLAARALAWAEADGRARRDGVSLFRDLSIPPSHFLMTDAREVGVERLAAIEEAGYRAVKLKVGHDPQAELESLARLGEDEGSGIQIRLDFNGRMEVTRVIEFIRSLPPAVRARLEFLEDPVPFDSLRWAELGRATGVPLALDRETSDRTAVAAAAREAVARVLVIKPAVEDAHDLAARFMSHASPAAYLVVTSYLGHPLGQAAAAVAAGSLARAFAGRVGTCGFLSHTVYEPTEFSECIQAQGPYWLAPEGTTGLGFDDLLTRSPWTELRG